jgi:hypothetical protein
MVSGVLHNCGFSLPKDQTSYLSCDARTERYGEKGQYIHAFTGTGGLRDVAILVLDLGIRWGKEVVTPHTANLSPGKKLGMHCEGD